MPKKLSRILVRLLMHVTDLAIKTGFEGHISRVQLAHLPTPIEELARLTQA
jgi:hypothetical protein